MTTATIKIRQVEARPDHHLHLRFSDGTSAVADFRPMLTKRAFRKLRDERLFAKAHVERGTVAWPGEIDIAPAALYALAHSLQQPETLEQARANEREMSLRELRQLAGATQVDVAKALGIDQGQLSRFERREDRLLSTLRRYVEALGGELEVVAVVGDKRVPLRGV